MDPGHSSKWYCSGSCCRLLSVWSNRLYRATFHRLLVPNDEAQRRRGRSSFVYFAVPDDDVTVEPLHSTSPTTPIKTSDYIHERFYGIMKY
ncbi:uncharacterized protein LOC143243997 isoform X3 [Tachypleus tridentatus]|uniref:uncharacterized protein LOC143243997 isoform X3 n=1 Tax=Tachypleus tridentatus TaxID=6853 RepID=UPI003FD568E5